MSQMALHALVGTALIDSQFCHGLLNGRRHSLLAEFDLTADEREVVLGVEAGCIQEFAVQLCEWLKAQENPAWEAAVSARAVWPGARRTPARRSRRWPARQEHGIRWAQPGTGDGRHTALRGSPDQALP